MRILNSCSFLFAIFFFNVAVAQPGVTHATYYEIEAKVTALFGPIYDVKAVNNIDSGFVTAKIQSSVLDDPYGTLKGCYVFAAVGKERDEEYTYKGFVGIYKNGEIIWHSDRIINNDFAKGAGIAATMDLNKDGTVEIVSDWSEGSHGADYLWIFSWDGRTGRLINAVDENGESALASLAWQFEFVDVDGNGILEIKGYWSEDLDTIHHSESPVIYSWNGQIYGKFQTAPEPPQSGYLPRNKVDAHLKGTVTNSVNGFRFQYRLENGSTSLQKIDELILTRSTDSITGFVQRKNWKFSLMKRSLMGWTNLFLTPNPIKQGETEASFVCETKALPAVGFAFVRGHNPTLSIPPYEEENAFRDITENSVRVYVLVPADPPDPFIPVSFLDTLFSYKHQAFNLNWIKNQGIMTSFDQKLENAKQQLGRGNTQSAKNILEAFLNEVEALNKQGNQITSEAYALLKFNAEYLISKL